MNWNARIGGDVDHRALLSLSDYQRLMRIMLIGACHAIGSRVFCVAAASNSAQRRRYMTFCCC